jgi:arylsulfatase A-like enzyme
VDAGRVADAYRQADAELGRLLASAGDDTTVLVMSDHGFRSIPPAPQGGHRLEGIWVAAGPGIAPSAERGELSVLDVAPTLLAGLGLPVGRDMDGRPRLDQLGLDTPVRVVDTYEAAGAAAAGVASAKTIDDTTEEQLRSLGYVE